MMMIIIIIICYLYFGTTAKGRITEAANVLEKHKQIIIITIIIIIYYLYFAQQPKGELQRQQTYLRNTNK